MERQNKHMHNPNHQHDQNEHDHERDDEHSPESAGLARGLARSAASRSAVGRLPVASSARAGKSAVRTAAARNNMRIRPRATMPKPTSVASKIKMRGGGGGGGARASTAASKVKVRSSAGNAVTKSAGSANRAATKVATPRGAGRGVNVRRIARASDRASTGLDLVEAASSEDTVVGKSEGNGKNRDVATRAKDILRRVPAFMSTLAKNTVLGMAVFATYEGVVEYDLPSSSSPSPSSDFRKGKISDMGHSDPFAAASLSRHAAAGFMAGTAHAGVNYTMEGMAQMRQTMFSGVAKPAATAPSSFLPYMMHHAISHSVLFCSYEGTKRILKATLGADHYNTDRDDHHEIDYSNLFAIGLAGGIAGSAQHVVSEYTEAALVNSYSKILRKDLTFMQRLNLLPRASLPSARVLAMAFIPSSIGFVAFEYGKEFMSDDE